MNDLNAYIGQIKKLVVPDHSPDLMETLAGFFMDMNPSLVVEITSEAKEDKEAFYLYFEDNHPKEIASDLEGACTIKINKDHQYIWIKSIPTAYYFMHYIFDHFTGEELNSFKNGKYLKFPYKWNRSCYDYFLTQEGRIQKGLNRETYVKELARLGFTHIEVNGLGYPMAIESGPKGETYPMFYTYCPALDQFVYSKLNKGIYPFHYLSGNLAYLKENVRLARKYGLIPGMLSFEPRSVPETFFQRYPMLRGARIDHPFRSFVPRYNMTICHPMVQEHYAELIQNLLIEVPELEFLSVWTNDSGAGFEHTKSLYVGRNGGAYMIREWKDDEAISKTSGQYALLFYRTLLNAAREFNPNFRIMTRMESFYGEHETIWNGFGDGFEMEGASTISRGWNIPYTHPKYSDSSEINAGSVFIQDFDEAETIKIKELRARNANAHIYFGAGPQLVFAPLMGIPYPGLTFTRINTLTDHGVDHISHYGGTFPPELVPYNLNQEVLRHWQTGLYNYDEILSLIINQWAKGYFVEEMKEVWRLCDEAVIHFPNVSTLYSTIGFTWYRLWTRPLVPDIESIPPEIRAYYEDYMCTTPHNPNNVDLSKDVLFELSNKEKASKSMERIDTKVWKPLNKAIELLESIQDEAQKILGDKNLIYDHLIRLKALKCWIMTQRNIAAWIVGVHTYVDAVDQEDQNQARKILQEMTDSEIKNSNELIHVLRSGIEFIATTDKGETPLMYGGNIEGNLLKKIELMELHRHDEPYIDPDYIFNNAGKQLS